MCRLHNSDKVSKNITAMEFPTLENKQTNLGCSAWNFIRLPDEAVSDLHNNAPLNNVYPRCSLVTVVTLCYRHNSTCVTSPI